MVSAVGETDRVPLSAFVPLQPPEAVHEATFKVDHERVAEEPEVIEVGEAESESIGAGVGVGAGGGGAPLPAACLYNVTRQSLRSSQVTNKVTPYVLRGVATAPWTPVAYGPVDQIGGAALCNFQVSVTTSKV